MLPNAALVHLCPCPYRKGESMSIYKSQGLVNTIWYKSQVSFIRSVIPLAIILPTAVWAMERDSSKQQQSPMLHSLPICVCCFPVAEHQCCHGLTMNANPTVNVSKALPCDLGALQWDLVSKAGMCLLVSGVLQPRNLCDQSLSSRFTAWEPALLPTVTLEIPVPVQDPAGGTQCKVTAAAALGRTASLVLVSCREV